MASNKNESPLENAAAELVKVALSETGGGKISKEVVTELKGLKAELGKLQKQASTDATLQKVEAQVQVLQKETVKIAAAVSAIEALNDRAEKLAKLQVLHLAIGNAGKASITNYTRKSEDIVTTILFSFMQGFGRYLTFNGYRDNCHYNSAPKNLCDDKEALESLVDWIWNLTGSKPLVQLGSDKKTMAIYETQS